jgi:hypothetical protein
MESIHHLAKCHAALLQPTPRLTQNLGNFLGVLSRGLANKHSHSGLTRHKISDHKPCERSNEGKAWMAKTKTYIGGWVVVAASLTYMLRVFEYE